MTTELLGSVTSLPTLIVVPAFSMSTSIGPCKLLLSDSLTFSLLPDDSSFAPFF
ncbi:unnamed protein product [Brugia timori]|uniref:Uncharacterized protein n=1 Tax=Brugia timori TaxID=42155 RepID=A0A3P7VSY2_9BILA|nr:unnamed protein product [Brugia timori]